ncbi:DedA family protein [Falsiroseomonas sp. E2-1-a20]|uniref:DedA family protein n=1 Tax=Falsiroseomonas sp. E2-1-a20 TaxID=3239300 RepID=UPI003F2F1902
MDHLIVPLIAWVEAHAAWAPAFAFAIAFIESVPLIGIFLPGSALLLGVGLLIGSGVLPPGPILAATFAGAVVGDALGFWLCRWLGPAFVRRHLPRQYRRMYARGVLAFRRWGVWAVFIARFISPLRAVAPIIAGVTRMRQWHFQVANVTSAVVWAPLLLMPGAAAGWIATVLGDRADPLLLVLLAVAALGAWLSLRAVWVRSGQPG